MRQNRAPTYRCATDEPLGPFLISRPLNLPTFNGHAKAFRRVVRPLPRPPGHPRAKLPFDALRKFAQDGFCRVDPGRLAIAVFVVLRFEDAPEKVRLTCDYGRDEAPALFAAYGKLSRRNVVHLVKHGRANGG